MSSLICFNYRYGYGNAEFSPSYDPVLDEITRKSDDLIQELIAIRQKLVQLKFGFDLNIVRNIDERLQRLLILFDFKDDEISEEMLDRKESENICPEKFQGTTFGYPLYKDGFKTEVCDYSRTIEELVTIVYDFTEYDNEVLKEIINQTVILHRKVPVKVITTSENLEISNFDNVQVFSLPKNFKNVGYLWNTLIKDVVTPYVFMAKDVLSMDYNLNFQRMVRIIIIPYIINYTIMPYPMWRITSYQNFKR